MIPTGTSPAEIWNKTALRRRAAAVGKDVETFVQEVVTEVLAEDGSYEKAAVSHGDFMAKLHEIINLHPASNGLLDDSRESIYSGRGE